MFRHYRPGLGRYLTPDPIGLAGGLNLYSYAGQNPINYTDPLGLSVWSDLWGAYRSASDVVFPTFWIADRLGDYAASLLPESIRGGRFLGTGYGEEATDYWASQYNRSNRALDWLGGATASLWTPETWFGTASTLACSRLARPATGTHSVYAGFDKLHKVRYVGATGRAPKVRFAEHFRAHGTGRELLNYRVVDGARNLTRAQARVWEQRLINQYGLGPEGGRLLNKINTIAPKYWHLYGIR